MAADTHAIIDAFQRARRDKTQVVLEGFHALKHALRFGAAVSLMVSPQPERVHALARTLTPDILPRLSLTTVPEECFAALTPRPPASPVCALAVRPSVPLEPLARAAGKVVVLDRPAHAGNVGAVVRTAAAAGAAGVVVLGGIDPWSPAAVRGGAGLQWAIPTCYTDTYSFGEDRPLIAFHEKGDSLFSQALPPRAALLFGSERRGIAPSLRARARATLAIPMRASVSSLNLAVSVGIVLYYDQWCA